MQQDLSYEFLEDLIGYKILNVSIGDRRIILEIDESIEDKRRWFRETYGYKADDESIEKKWKEKEK